MTQVKRSVGLKEMEQKQTDGRKDATDYFTFPENAAGNLSIRQLREKSPVNKRLSLSLSLSCAWRQRHKSSWLNYLLIKVLTSSACLQ